LDKKSLVHNGIWMIVLTLFARVTGFAREVALSYVYGSSAMSDAYITGTSLSLVVFSAVGFAFSNAYIPVASGIENTEDRRRFTNNLMTVSFLLLAAVSLLMIVFIRPITSLLAAGFTGQTFDNTVTIGVFALLCAPFQIIMMVAVSYFNMDGRFVYNNLQSLVTNGIIIATLFITIGSAFLLGLGYFAAVLAPALLITFLAMRHGLRLRPFIDLKDPCLKQVLIMSVPVFFGQVAAQANIMIDRSFASTLGEGIVSSMKYANLVCSFATTVFASSIAIVIFPRLSEHAAKGETDRLKTTTVAALRTFILIIAPLTLGAIFLAHPIISLLFERGAFTAEDTAITSAVLQIYALGLLGSGMFEIFNRAFYAVKNTKLPVILYSICMGVNIVLNASFIGPFGYRGLAAATSISATLTMLLLGIAFRKQFGHFGFSSIAVMVIKCAAAGAVMALGIQATQPVFDRIALSGIVHKLLAVGGPAAVGILGYCLVLFVLKVPEMKNAVSYSTRKIRGLFGRNEK